MENKYLNAKIYKITDNTLNSIYIGSTYKTLNNRLKQHEYDYKKFKNGNFPFMTSFKIIENNDYKIELIKLFACENKQQLNIEEGIEIKQAKTNGLNVVNRNIAGLTHNESSTQYYKKNKNKLNEKIHCVCGGKFVKCSKLRHERTKKHQDYIKKTVIINNGTININITVNNIEDLQQLELDFLKAINK